MPNKNFTQFDSNLSPLAGDNLVGFNSGGTSEYKTTVEALLSANKQIQSGVNFGLQTPGAPVGNFSFTSGRQNVASGLYTHAEGYLASATNIAAHAEGQSTSASGQFSHAEGNNTTASGASSHAEGISTRASGQQSHAEGTGTVASGDSSHAEGEQSVASGVNSHAEGDSTIASEYGAHAEGGTTIASGSYSHAEGNTTVASGDSSHAEGEITRARGHMSHAAGYAAEAAHDRTWVWKGSTSTSHLSTTRANQFMVSAAGGTAFFGSVGIGTDNNTNGLTVVGNVSAVSLLTTFGLGSATANYSFAVGSGRATGIYSHAEGVASLASGYGSHAEGNGTTASGNLGSHAEGFSTTASASGSHAEGWQTQAIGGYGVRGPHAEGLNTIASAEGAHAEGVTTTASGYASHSEGQNTIASGLMSHAEGVNTSAIGGYSHAEGYSTSASGAATHAEGFQTSASGFGSHAEGAYTRAVGGYSHASGLRAAAQEPGSWIWRGMSVPNFGAAETTTTRAGQFMVSAEGGVALFGNVGIGVDAFSPGLSSNALTVVGNISSTGTSVIDTNSSNPGLRITHTGTGMALLVEDSSNPDATPFAVLNDGTLMHGATANPGTGLGARAGVFVSNSTAGRASYEFRNHATAIQGPDISFIKTRTGNSNDYTGTLGLSANDVLGQIRMRAGTGANGFALAAVNKYNSTSGGVSGSKVTFTTHDNVTNGTVIPLTLDETRVGIGTTSPNETLTVVGNISATGIISGTTQFEFASAALFLKDGGNNRRNSDPTQIYGTNEDQHLRFRAGGATNNEIRFTILSSGDVGIGTTIAETAAAGNGGLIVKNDVLVGNASRPSGSMLSAISNGNFANTTGMAFNGTDWYGGTVPNWSGPTDATYTVYYNGTNYYRNLGAGSTGPGSSSARQTLGTLRSTSNVIVDFANVTAPFGTATLSAAIYDAAYNVFAIKACDGVNSYRLSAENVPAFTNVMVGFWGTGALSNVSLTAVNTSNHLTVAGQVSASHVSTSRIEVRDGVVILKNIPTSSTGLPVGAVYNDSGFLKIV